MITLPSKFASENAKAEKTPAVIVKLLDTELENEQTTNADWIANSAESNVDYTPTPPDAGDVILASQAESYTAKTADVQLYDHTAVNINGVMYTMGGVISLVAPKAATNTLRKYVIATDTWTALTNLVNARTGHVAVGDGTNLIYMGGGRNTRDSSLPSVLYGDWNSYDTTTGVWTVLAALPAILYDAAATYYNGKIYLSGGRVAGGNGVNTLYVYDVATNSWATLTAMPRAFDRHSMVLWANGGMSGQLIVHGGEATTGFASAETWAYDIDTDSWAQRLSGSLARAAHAAVIIADRMVIIGGKTLNISPSVYYADLWEYDLLADRWIQRTSRSHAYARHTAVAEGSTIVIYAGRETLITYSDTALYQAVIFQASGFLTTQTMDLGAVPTVAGEFIAKDIRPEFTSIQYEAWRSATGVFGGEEIYLGIVVDGQAVPLGAAAQYYRTKFTLSTTNTLFSPTVESVKVSFSTYLSYSDAGGFGYEPAVFNISSLTTSIDTFKESSIGQMTVKLAFIKTLSDWLNTKYPKNKLVKILVGFVADGFTETDFIDFFWGQMNDWAISNKDEVTITIRDYKTEWAVDVPAKWETTADNVTWTAQHPVDVVLDILRNEINVRDSKLDLGSFATVKTTLAGWVVTRTITKNPEQADTLIHELMGLMSAFVIPKGDGKISIKRFNPLEASVKSLTDNNTFNKSWKANAGSLINNLFVYSDHNGVGNDTSDYGDLRVAVDVTSQVNYDELATKEIRDKWTRQDAHTLFTNGDFEAGNTSGWSLLVNTGIGAIATFAAVAAVPPFKGSWNGRVSITNGGAAADDVLIRQTGMSITSGHIYKITFGVTSNANYGMQVKFRRTADPFLSYTDDAVETVNITSGYATYEIKYTANITAVDLAVYFLCGLGPTSVNIDDVRIVDMALEQTDAMTAIIMARYATPPPIITVDADADTMALEAGDIVDATMLRAPSSDMTGVGALKMQIVNKNMDFKKNKNKLTLLRV